MDYKNLYNKLIEKTVNYKRARSKNLYLEKHHIVPKSLGGTEEQDNLVLLTYKEHYIAHHLLWKIHRNSEMALAFIRITNRNTKQLKLIGLIKPINAKEFEQLKIKAVNKLRENGIKLYEQKSGIHTQTTEERKLSGIKSRDDKTGIHALSKPELTLVSKKGYQSSIKLMSVESRLEADKKGGKTAGKLNGFSNGNNSLLFKKAIHSQTIEERKRLQKICSEKSTLRGIVRWENSLRELNLSTSYKPTLEESKKLSLKRFWGSICNKHPSLNGMRYVSSRMCYECIREY